MDQRKLLNRGQSELSCKRKTLTPDFLKIPYTTISYILQTYSFLCMHIGDSAFEFKKRITARSSYSVYTGKEMAAADVKASIVNACQTQIKIRIKLNRQLSFEREGAS
uniref:Uncharacterized protein n=1 Tax=Sipha flava TaxID=143950 RepID=A0A2S2QTV9_9HEMI